jgi:hypothetical protein
MRAVLTIIAAAMVSACASAGNGSSYDPYRITREEVEASTHQTAYDIVRTLRSRWLQPVAGMSIRSGQAVAQVYLDGVRQPGIGALQTIPKMIIQEIRFYPPAEAQARWGLNHEGGAIEVVTREGGGGGRTSPGSGQD